MPADRTRLRGVSQVYQPYPNARRRCLVGEKQAQLKEGPGVSFIPLLSTNRDSLSDACEVFEGQCLVRDDGFVDQRLGNLVVDILHVAPFAPSQTLQTPCGGTGAT
jgi:hypothetical protein